MRIVFVDDAPGYGGAQIAAVNMAALMADDLGHEVHFFAAPDNLRLIQRLGTAPSLIVHADGYAARPLFIVSHILYLWRLPSLVRKLRGIDPDLVIVNMSGLEFGWLYIYACALLRVPRICWLHNPFEYGRLIAATGWRKILNGARDRFATLWARTIVRYLHIVSPSSRRHLLGRLGLRDGVRVWSNVFPQVQGVPPAVDLRSALDPRYHTVAVVPGRIDFGHKGQNALVPHLGTLASNGIALIFVGDGADLADLKSMCAGHDNVVFTGWSDQVDSYLRAADVVLLPSHYEAQPLILMEVLRQGAPVVMSPIAPFAEMLDSRFVDGFDDAASLVASIHRVRAFPPQQLASIYDAVLAPFAPVPAQAGVAAILKEYQT